MVMKVERTSGTSRILGEQDGVLEDISKLKEEQTCALSLNVMLIH